MRYEVRVQRVLNEIRYRYQKILGRDLVGIYLHGSLAFGCFSWNRSDIDFIVVTENNPSQEKKEALIEVLLSMEYYGPVKGFEMSIVQESVCRSFVYPTPFVLHYSSMYREACKADLKAYCCKMHGVDKDLAAHMTVIKKAGVVLIGREIHSVFGEVPANAYWDSICNDIINAVDEIKQNSTNVILNLCRVLAYRRDGLILSKFEGAIWAEKWLPSRFSELIHGAGNVYTGREKENIDTEKREAFACYMLKEIFSKESYNGKRVDGNV